MQFPHIDPVFLSIGPLQFRWYGLMYVLAFAATYFLLRSEVRRKQYPLTKDDVADLVFYGAMGVVLGGRLGYILFYDLKVYLADPLQVFAVWKGGMSFHGGFLGVILSFVLFARRKNISFWALIDMAAQCAPIGLGLGRIGNFINGELYGRQTDVPWGMVFPGGGELPRHPSQLYEAFLEGLVLFFIVRIMSRRSDVTGIPAWTFCAGYGLFRFIVELFRQPDAQIGFFFNFFSMGQLLSLPMFLVGSFMVFRLSRRAA
ncbi:prolipoprotein diacylglyceryl transferase [Oryzomonas sagensis]|uniref:Phosphatidylglycerol--prolipoprotein diacylglyceryl transferase n=1 Tax=Oryzomonas sagensis TaxID=2603857 RepID=A0ABQ6TPS2_9BACT|nr:prolipoprotein diacylglyceryl transferase [Oryzomonas sagensis]KAB0671033.1 prolipoprotein diacylglyceryl transferase [Oryzomonas sagensis]